MNRIFNLKTQVKKFSNLDNFVITPKEEGYILLNNNSPYFLGTDEISNIYIGNIENKPSKINLYICNFKSDFCYNISGIRNSINPFSFYGHFSDIDKYGEIKKTHGIAKVELEEIKRKKEQKILNTVKEHKNFMNSIDNEIIQKTLKLYNI